jgi:hypothetical protein
MSWDDELTWSKTVAVSRALGLLEAARQAVDRGVPANQVLSLLAERCLDVGLTAHNWAGGLPCEFCDTCHREPGVSRWDALLAEVVP